MTNLPDPNTIWQRGMRVRRVIHAGLFTDRTGREKCVVTYNNGGDKNRRCSIPVWRRWSRHAEIVGEIPGELTLEAQ